MGLRKKQQFWKLYIHLKKFLRFAVDFGSFVLILMSCEQAFVLNNWALIKPWKIASIMSKLARLLKSFDTVFQAA